MKGGVTAGFRISSSCASTSISPLFRLELIVPSGRRRTTPVTRSTNSLRTRSAVAKVSLRSGSLTTCTSPSRSRRSMKITPPWSRRRWAQPKRVTALPRYRVSVLPQYSVRIFVSVDPHGFARASHGRLGHAHRDDVLEGLVDRHVELDRLRARHHEEEA